MKFFSHNDEIKEVTAQLLDVFNNLEIRRIGQVNNQIVTKTINVPCVAGHRSRILKSLENRDKTLKLPLISLAVKTFHVDRKRIHSINDVLLYGTSSINLLHNTAVPITIDYELNIVTKYLIDMDQLWSTITAVMTPDFFIATNNPFNDNKLKIQVIKDDNLGLKIPEENKDKPYRFTAQIGLKAKAWQYPGNKAYSLGIEPIIKKINLCRIYGTGSNEDGDTVEDYFSRWYDVRNESIDTFIEAVKDGLIEYPNYDEFEVLDAFSGGLWLNDIYAILSGDIYDFSISGDLQTLIANENNPDMIVTTFREDGSFFTPETLADVDWSSVWRRMLSGDLACALGQHTSGDQTYRYFIQDDLLFLYYNNSTVIPLEIE